ncbi:MAG TPA: DUF971 domain-containing protein [Pyrinomonadaceae bacterium]|nr:DUF971 domain-containing protein [Pyrinomonadaceae bacterium]
MNFEPREIIDEGSEFRIRWADDAESVFNAPDLRRHCACAQCINEWTGEQMLDPKSVSDEVTIENISLVGRYALSFKFSDNHETGIYSFKYLRELSDKKIQRPAPKK